MKLDVTPAQLRAINAALALLECEKESDRDGLHSDSLAVIRRARSRVHEALDAHGIEP